MGFFLFQNRCTKSCPDGFFGFVDESIHPSSSGKCFKCHYSCRTCHSFTNCTDCYTDAELHGNGRCYAKELVEEVIELERWYTAVSVVFLCLCFVILMLVIYVITDKNPGLLSCFVSASKPRRTFISLRSSLSSNSSSSHQHFTPGRLATNSGLNLHGNNSRSHDNRPALLASSLYCDDQSEDEV